MVGIAARKVNNPAVADLRKTAVVGTAYAVVVGLEVRSVAAALHSPGHHTARAEGIAGKVARWNRSIAEHNLGLRHHIGPVDDVAVVDRTPHQDCRHRSWTRCRRMELAAVAAGSCSSRHRRSRPAEVLVVSSVSC